MTDSPGALFEQLLAIMARLRAVGGCPWDREQTHVSLKPYLIEEAYEVLEAIESSGAAALREELGDLLFQVVFHAQLAHEDDAFDMAGVLEHLNAKMISRHPHVFADVSVGSAQDALTQWEAIKRREATERGEKRSVLAGVPRALPSLVRAQRIQAKAARVNFDWPDARAAWEKVREEVNEVAGALQTDHRERLSEELGDLLFSLVNVARLANIDAEDASQRAIEKFQRRFTQMEADLSARGMSWDAASADELDRAWERAKSLDRDENGTR
jgi:tetrapyrrole methylase family protein/MazG family protein